MKFIDTTEFVKKEVIVKKEKKIGIFSEIDESTMETDSLLRCRIVKKGKECSDTFKEEDLVLVRADTVRSIKYDELSEYWIVNNEDLIFCKLNE